MTKISPVSFVMPAYNCADTVVESVESITQGNFEDGDELIIVNDGSTDDTARVLLDLKAEYPFIDVMHNGQNKGCPAARNVGISRAQNPLIFNLDSDDILVPGSRKQLQRFMVSHGADAAAFGEIHFFQESIDKVTHKWMCHAGVLTLADFLAGPIVPGGNYMYTKASWKKVGGYWEYGAGLHEFWGFTLKLIASGLRFVVMPDGYYYHRYGHDSLYVRESATPGASSLMATEMIAPFLELLDERDAEYVTSDEGARLWLENLGRHPIRLKSGEIGRTGKRVDLKSSGDRDGVPLIRFVKRAVRRLATLSIRSPTSR